jgi:acetyltransferase
LLFGLGGQLVEVFKDRALGLPPLNATLARRMIERTKIFKALKGVRGRKSIDLNQVDQILVRFSQLISEQRWIKELDINPLLVSPERILALDARIVLQDPEVNEEDLPRLAIRAYPNQYTSEWKAKNGVFFTIRPIRPEDEPLLVKFHENLSDRSVYLRYLHPILLSQRVTHERLARICHGDYDREITLIASEEDPETGECRIIGAGRISKMHSLDEARVSILMSDLYQGKGIGSELLRQIISVSKEEKLRKIEAIITQDNAVMRYLFEKLGFTISVNEYDQMIRAEMHFD